MRVSRAEEPLIDSIIEEYLYLREEVRPLLARIEEIRSWCKSQGSFSTERFVCVVKTKNRRCISGLDTLLKVLGKSEEELIELGLMRIISFLDVTVGEKPEG